MEKKTSTGGNWWDKLGKPQHGGEMVIHANRNIINFDPYFTEGLTSIYGGWMERLISDDWTVDPATWDFKLAFHPNKYRKGQLAESWEFPDPNTHVVHLRKGVHWQNRPPANGREFIADDVIFHFNRMYGLGGGFTKPSPFRASEIRIKDLISMTAPDKYTVVFKFKTPNPEFIMEALHDVSQAPCLENPDVVRKWGDVKDWHHAIGTGPFILQDFVPEKSATMVRNPDYWGHDERYPQNKLPYVDKITYLMILDDAEALKAMSMGKIDIIHQVSSKQAEALRKTNPEIVQIPMTGPTITLQPRNDKAPFNDIRVRKAMQMALDLPAIAKSYYGGNVEPYPDTLTSRDMKGWGFPYEEWPQDLKDEYAYNPTAAKKLLVDAGFSKGLKTHVVADTDADMDMLQIIKTYLSAIGIDMEIRPMKPTEFFNYLLDRKHDQLVYRGYAPIGLSKSPLRVITQFKTGYSANYLMADDPVYDTQYSKAIAATSEDQLRQALKDANERVARGHFVISLFKPVAYSLCQPWLKGYNAQIHSVWMEAGGPSMLSLYGARFWIDQKVKKSLGH